jgi:hypothetical protein
MSFESELDNLDGMITYFKWIVKEYPASEAYEHTLNLLLKRRAELADTIGKEHAQ